jgi:hypothetical protein
MKDIKPQAAKWTDYDLWTNSPHMTDELVKMIKSMVEEIPTRRPKSSEILASCDLLVKRRDGFVASRSHNNLCCVEGPLQYEILEEARNELQLFKRLGGYEANR